MTIPNIESWDTGRLFAAYRNSWNGGLRMGKVSISLPLRLTNSPDDVIIPPGPFREQQLSMSGSYSFDITLPGTDDSGLEQSGWGWTVKVELDATQTDAGYVEIFYGVQVPVGGSTNLRLLQPSNRHEITVQPSADLRHYAKKSELPVIPEIDWQSAIDIMEAP